MERRQLINLLEDYFEGLINNEIETIPLHDDVIFNDPMVPDELSGKENVYEFLSDLAGAFSNIQYHIDRDIIDGDYVCSILKLRLSEGQILEMCTVIGIEENLIKSIRSYYDPRPMMQ